MLLLRLNSLSSKRCLAFLLLFSLVFGCSAKFFSAKAAVIVTETLKADLAVGITADGTVISAGDNRAAAFEIESGRRITITRSSLGTGKNWEIGVFTRYPAVGVKGYRIYAATNNTKTVSVTVPDGYTHMLVSAGGGYASGVYPNITVEYESDIVIPDIPSYDGSTSASGSVVTGVQQGYQFDGVSIDTVTSQLTASLVEETALPIDNDGDGITDDFVLKSVYKVPVLVSCTITNTSDRYAWLNGKTIGYTPTFNSNIPLLADAATEYRLCDIFYTSKGFAEAVTTDGTVHFRFDDSNYYLGNVIVKPMSTLSASALLYYDITVIMTVPAAAEYYSYLTAVAMIMRTTIINSVGLSGIDAINGMLEYIPTDSTSMGQQQINNSVVQQGQQVQQSINALQTQQQQQFVEFMTPADESDLADRFSGIEDQIELLSFYAVANDVILRFRDLINREPPPAELSFPAFGLEINGEYQGFWDSYTFSFTDWGQNFPVLVDALHFATLGALCFAMVRFCNKLINKIWGAQV